MCGNFDIILVQISRISRAVCCALLGTHDARVLIWCLETGVGADLGPTSGVRPHEVNERQGKPLFDCGLVDQRSGSLKYPLSWTREYIFLSTPSLLRG